ncbi:MULTISPECIES: hypothetical protein [unclassified Herbaspirillum]|uniref:hypothetical protein n=1 Tax=unclassified Herbaspirillum TaxID=2624150 RepID=UPI00114EB813|nr:MULTISPECIES: hypothetical protein [unclassified Herbaspirillum]MBB5391063.1 hypothetical protein [Herbaspirillum sp. SJZ102]
MENLKTDFERIPKLHPGRSGLLDDTAHIRNQRIEVVFSPDELEILDKNISATDYRTRSQYIRNTSLNSKPLDQKELGAIQIRNL